jgi:hypothetical protein
LRGQQRDFSTNPLPFGSLTIGGFECLAELVDVSKKFFEFNPLVVLEQFPDAEQAVAIVDGCPFWMLVRCSPCSPFPEESPLGNERAQNA